MTPASRKARTDAELYALSREVFVAAVSGDMRTSAEAENAVARRLDELARIDASDAGDGPAAES